ncbi:glycosyl hydrolase [Sphingomonas sp. Leaf412]|uniref:glycoside hydrolase family 9 protein n=1 Tax=Sphingomonas sp. Leaf412 TaxID=1736370 RepID=UPI0006F55572|nr:glycoside hydrolase family 9 protein [Sphingomonas sp. Leaf412]KQT33010.1 glycosyl hydrolase [Sphingomonas sp. Leaf412]
MIAALLLATAVRIGGLGFAPADAKAATIESEAAAPIAWRVEDAAGRAVLSGRSEPAARDDAAGRRVHRVDLSALRTPGAGYRLIAGAAASPRFAVAPGLYRPLARDALTYFYHNRAGTPIEARFVGARWARPAGHPDERATCFSGADRKGVRWPGCAYTLDVTGGWYDAGDHGKYVVNGGIALWTLLDMAARGVAFPDRSLSIPESGNGVDDLLDEARYELDFLLRMQVPAGQELAGMAHHKVADARWTALPLRPDRDPETRLLYPPSTAATLNLAAVAAQGARLWRGIDPAFARRCAEASARAWAAAKRHPAMLATGDFAGSGNYGDADVSDEIFWAAAERWVLTRDPALRRAIDASRHLRASSGEAGWAATAPLGLMTLAQAGDPTARTTLIAAAGRFRDEARRSGYGIPLAGTAYVWGSNAVLLNRAMILAIAADRTRDESYRAPVIATLDYLTGRNPLGRSYVSGYGPDPMRHPHHRFWAAGVDPAYPPAPPGALSGGPNATPGDDVARAIGKCAPMTCWRDDARAYSLNEVAINWNAPLAWVAAWRDATEARR